MEWLSSLYASLLVVLLYLAPMFLLAGVAIYTKKTLAKNRISPLGADLLRPAGYSLQKSIDDLQSELMEAFIAVPFLCTSMPLIMLAQEKLLDKPVGWFAWVLAGALVIVGTGYYLLKAVRTLKQLARLRLGLACEMAVGQELDQVVRPESHPYRVFHDLQFEGFNVDHLVVGPNGVFVIETKGRSKPVLDGKKQAKLRLEGDALHFPTHVETKPLEQVRMNVKAVQKWLNEATGFDVPVAGVLVLPGWFIERKQRAVNPYVLSAKELPAQLPRLRAGSLDLGQVRSVAFQVTGRVQDVNRDRVD